MILPSPSGEGPGVRSEKVVKSQSTLQQRSSVIRFDNFIACLYENYRYILTDLFYVSKFQNHDSPLYFRRGAGGKVAQTKKPLPEKEGVYRWLQCG